MERTTKELILAYAHDLAVDFLIYDRKNDEDLPTGVIEQAIEDKVITLDEIIQSFGSALKSQFCE